MRRSVDLGVTWSIHWGETRLKPMTTTTQPERPQFVERDQSAPVPASIIADVERGTAHTFKPADFEPGARRLESFCLVGLDRRGTLLLAGEPIPLHRNVSRAEIEAGHIQFVTGPTAQGEDYDSFMFAVHDGQNWGSGPVEMTIRVVAPAVEAKTVAPPIPELPVSEPKNVTPPPADPTLGNAVWPRSAAVKSNPLAAIRAKHAGPSTPAWPGLDQDAGAGASQVKKLAGLPVLNKTETAKPAESAAVWPKEDNKKALPDALAMLKAKPKAKAPEETGTPIWPDATGPKTTSIKTQTSRGLDLSPQAGTPIWPEATKPAPKPKAIEPVIEAPVLVEPEVVEPVIEAPVLVEPEVVDPVIEAPVLVEPEVVEPVIEAPVPVEPEVVEPVIEAPVLVEPEVVEPVIEAPVPAEPVVDAPAARDLPDLQTTLHALEKAPLQMVELGFDLAAEPPCAQDNQVVTSEGSFYAFKPSDFNFAGPEGRFLKVRVEASGTCGSLQFDNREVVVGQEIEVQDIGLDMMRFHPADPGKEGFEFRVFDGAEWSTEAYSMVITIKPYYHPPTASNGRVEVQLGQRRDFELKDFRFNSLCDGDVLHRVIITGYEMSGSVCLDGIEIDPDQVLTCEEIETGRVEYVPRHAGSKDVLHFRVHDGTAESKAIYSLQLDVSEPAAPKEVSPPVAPVAPATAAPVPTSAPSLAEPVAPETIADVTIRMPAPEEAPLPEVPQFTDEPPVARLPGAVDTQDLTPRAKPVAKPSTGRLPGLVNKDGSGRFKAVDVSQPAPVGPEHREEDLPPVKTTSLVDLTREPQSTATHRNPLPPISGDPSKSAGSAASATPPREPGAGPRPGKSHVPAPPKSQSSGRWGNAKNKKPVGPAARTPQSPPSGTQPGVKAPAHRPLARLGQAPAVTPPAPKVPTEDAKAGPAATAPRGNPQTRPSGTQPGVGARGPARSGAVPKSPLEGRKRTPAIRTPVRPSAKDSESATPKAAAPKAAAPKAAAPKAGAPKAGAPKAGAPKAGAPKAGARKAAPKKAAAPKAAKPKPAARAPGSGSQAAAKVRRVQPDQKRPAPPAGKRAAPPSGKKPTPPSGKRPTVPAKKPASGNAKVAPKGKGSEPAGPVVSGTWETASDGSKRIRRDYELAVTTSSDQAFAFSPKDLSPNGIPVSEIEVVMIFCPGFLQFEGMAVNQGQRFSRVDLEAGRLTFLPASLGNKKGFEYRVRRGPKWSTARCTMSIEVTQA